MSKQSYVYKNEPIPFNVLCQMTHRTIIGIGVSAKKTYQGYFRKTRNSQIMFETVDNKVIKVELPSYGTYANEILNVIITETGKQWSFYEEI